MYNNCTMNRIMNPIVRTICNHITLKNAVVCGQLYLRAFSKSCDQVFAAIYKKITMSIQYSFAGKSVLITGGSQGIGRQLVQRFHDGGANVFTFGKNPERIQKLREELPGVRAEVVDLADWDATRQVVESFGTIDHLVNNAAALVIEHFMDITKDSADVQFDVNVSAVINVTQVVAKGLIAANREGSVVNLSSVGARLGNFAGAGVYSATKAALENLTKTMALELGAQKIRVNCIHIGAVETALLKKYTVSDNPFVVQIMMARPVIKRPVEKNEVADLVIFLLCPLSSMIVGEGVVIDGGILTN